MKPIKPKYSDTVKIELNISKKSKEILNQYSKYTKYDESEIVDIIICDIMEDSEFINWLKNRRYTTKVNKLIFDNSNQEGIESNEENEDLSYF